MVSEEIKCLLSYEWESHTTLRSLCGSVGKMKVLDKKNCLWSMILSDYFAVSRKSLTESDQHTPEINFWKNNSSVCYLGNSKGIRGAECMLEFLKVWVKKCYRKNERRGSWVPPQSGTGIIRKYFFKKHNKRTWTHWQNKDFPNTLFWMWTSLE